MRPSGTEPRFKSSYEVRIAVGADEAIATRRGRGLAELGKLRDAHQALLACALPRRRRVDHRR
jgi:hypothetical protein